MTPKEILDQVCADNNISMRELANLVGAKEQQLYDIRAGKIKKISKDLACKISSVFPDYSIVYLMTGSSNVTTVNVDMTDNSGNSGVIASHAHDISNVSAQGDALVQALARKDEELKALRAENKALKADNKQLRSQISDMTKTILNLSKK